MSPFSNQEASAQPSTHVAGMYIAPKSPENDDNEPGLGGFPSQNPNTSMCTAQQSRQETNSCNHTELKDYDS